MKRLLPLLLLVLSSCDRCQRDGGVADGSVSTVVATGVDAGRPAVDATDLRSALFLVFPEFRVTKVQEAMASLERVSRLGKNGTPLPQVAEALKQKGWTIESTGEDRLITASNPPFLLLARVESGTLTQTLRLPLTEDQVHQIFGAPAAQTTETLGERFAELPGLVPLEETFRFHLAFASTVDRAGFIAGRQVRALLDDGWKMTGPAILSDRDAGYAALPSRFEALMENPPLGSRMTILRNESEVRVDLEQPIRVRSR